MNQPKRIRIVASDPTCNLPISEIIGCDYEVISFDSETKYVWIDSTYFGKISIRPDEYEVLEESDPNKFGRKWNEHTWEFETHFDDNQFIIERPFSSKTMKLNCEEAKCLHGLLSNFLTANNAAGESDFASTQR